MYEIKIGDKVRLNLCRQPNPLPLGGGYGGTRFESRLRVIQFVMDIRS